MPNTKKSTLKTSKKQHNHVLSNSLRLKSPQGIKAKQNLANILERLPFLRQLNALQNQTLNVMPVWQAWLKHNDNEMISRFASLSNVSDNTLYIQCTQSSTATLLKHKKGSLLEQLQKTGFEQIQNIKIQMQLNTSQATSNAKPTMEDHRRLEADKLWKKPSASAIKSIEITQSNIKNEQLASSLQRLAETLKKAT